MKDYRRRTKSGKLVIDKVTKLPKYNLPVDRRIDLVIKELFSEVKGVDIAIG